MSLHHNRHAWNARAAQAARFTRPATDDDFAHPGQAIGLGGWLPADVRGLRVLCLAAGGGKHGPLYAAAGAETTVVDLSGAMLELDRQVAAERGLRLRVVETSMDDLGMFAPGEFDLVMQPVSTCYAPQARPTYRAVARVTRAGGLYVSQHKQPTSMQAETAPSPRGYALVEPYYRQGPLPAVTGSLHREEGTLEYLHRWEELLGHLCREGFVIEDLDEPLHADERAAPGSFGHRSRFVAPYVRVKARRRGASEPAHAAKRLWTPES